MSLVDLYGGHFVPIGAGIYSSSTAPATTSSTIDAANEAVIHVGRVITSDRASHTIDTTGSSALGWRTGSVTFANAGTTLKVGLAAVDLTAGPPVRAANAADVITFDVNASFTGGGGGVTANAWQTSVPTAGTKTIANGDLVAFAVQMTARAGVDTVAVTAVSGIGSAFHRPTVSTFLSAAYAAVAALPNAIIVFSDGAIGWFYTTDVTSAALTRTWNSSDATKEYGQLFKLPFPTKIYGLWGFLDPDADCDVVLYSDPLGTPVPEKTISIDANAVTAASGRRFFELFPAPYSTTTDQLIGAVFKPGGTNVTASYKTIGNATHRVTDPWGTQGYGISRASGAFANANSSLDHYYIGLLIGSFEAGGGGNAKASGNMMGGLL
jgi:hypothetical protein